jgi:hypothetical protein
MKIPVPGRNRDGFALPVALLAMIVIGAIVTGGFYISAQEHDVSISTDQGTRALNVAQYGLEEALANWTTATIDNYAGPVSGTVWNGSRQVGTYEISLMRLGDPGTGARVYALESEGRAMRGQQPATRRVGSFVRTMRAQAPYATAMTIIGELHRAGNAVISGTDVCGAEGVVPGIMALDDADVTGVYKGTTQQMITGDPPVAEDPDMTLQTLSTFGELTLADLIAMRTHYYVSDPLGATDQHMRPYTTPDGSACDVSVKRNWGDPSNTPGPCGSYYPIVYVEGDAYFDVGVGQGILIVSGNMQVYGNFEFSGVVIVMGSFHMEGTGSKINGTVIVQGEGSVDTSSAQTGDAKVQYDSCKVRAAFENNLRVRPLATRSWFADTPPLPVAGP